MVLRRGRWTFMRDWSGVPLWPVPMTVLAIVWLAAAVGSVAEREPGMPVAPRPAAGASAGDESDAARVPSTRPAEQSVALEGLARW